MSKVAIVTGASRGIGAATAERLAQEGWDVVVNYHHTAEGAEAVKTTVEAMGQRCIVVKADVSRWDQVEAMVKETMDTFGRIDAVVNNAGIYARSKLADLDMADWHEALDVNLTGAFYLVKASLPNLKEGAAIVNFTSIIAQDGTRHGVHYASAKGGVISLTQSLAKELGPQGIRVNCIAPGAIDTDMIGEDSTEKRAAREKSIPLRRVGRPDEIASVVNFLLSPDASYINGAIIDVNGGA